MGCCRKAIRDGPLQRRRQGIADSLLRNGHRDWALHVSKCRLVIKSCARCSILRFLAQEVHRLPGWARCVPSDPSSPAWMAIRRSGRTASSVHFGCLVCAAAGADSDWGRVCNSDAGMAHIWRLKRHAASQSHQVSMASANMASWNGIVCVHGRQVPEADIFCQILRGESGGAKRWKLRKLKQCCAEAVRRLNLQKLKTCDSISIRQDVGNGWLAIRFVGASRSLATHQGLLGAIDMSEFSTRLLTIYTRECIASLNEQRRGISTCHPPMTMIWMPRPIFTVLSNYLSAMLLPMKCWSAV